MEPERNIEKLLRAYAKKRGDDAGAPLELHPATRRLLQGEVARRAPKRPESGLFPALFAILRRRLVFALTVVAMMFAAVALLLPALSTAKSRSQKVAAASQLRQLDLAIRNYTEANNRAPARLDDLKGYLPEKTLIDPLSGKPFVYVGGQGGRGERGNAVLAYSPEDRKGRVVLFADGSVATLNDRQFAQATRGDVMLLSSARKAENAADIATGEGGLTRSARTLGVQPTAASAPAETGRRAVAQSEAKAIDALATPPVETEESSAGAKVANDETKRLPTEPETTTFSIGSGASLAAREGKAPATTTGLSLNEPTRNPPPAAESITAVPRASFRETADAGALKPAPDEREQADTLAGLPRGTNATFALATETAAAPELRGNLSIKPGPAEALPAAFSNSQRFVQVMTPAALPAASKGGSAPATGPTPVLASFQMEQNGNEIRIVDKDGSVYNGSVQWTNTALADQAAPAPDSAGVVSAPALKEGLQPEHFNFEVNGMNRSLNQNVQFNGSLVTAANADFWRSNAGALRQLQFQALPNNQLQLPLANARINGTAILDHGREIQINAVPAKP